MLREQIDVVAEMSSQYNIRPKITLAFDYMNDDDFAETRNFTITYNSKALRNRTVTEANLNSDNTLAATNSKGISAHEMGHIISRVYGENGLDIAKKAYYNIYNKEPNNSEILAYLRKSVST